MQLTGATSLGSFEDVSKSMKFVIQSQTNPGMEHYVDWLQSSCSCESFVKEGLSWCKHLSAVRIPSEKNQNVWIEEDPTTENDSVSLPHLSIDSSLPVAYWDPSPSTSISSLPELEADYSNSPNESLLELEDCDQGDNNGASGDVDDANLRTKLWLAIVPMLQAATSITVSTPQPSGVETSDLHAFHDILWRITGSTRPNVTQAPRLPPVLRLPSNINTSTETAAAMPPIKRKREIQHNDPYAAGERSGKKVKGKHKPPQPLPALSSLSATSHKPPLPSTAV